MFAIIRESGFAGWAAILLTIVGLAAITTVGRRQRRPGGVAAIWAVAILACGALGMGMGQRLVDRGVRGQEVEGTPTSRPLMKWPDNATNQRLDILSIGSREASANLYLAGAGALVLLLVGGALALFQKEGGEAKASPSPTPSGT